MNFEEKTDKLSEYIDKSDNIVFLGGAGVSTESGIPDFRSAGGLYNGMEQAESRYDAPPEVILSRTYFFAHTEKFYDFYKSKMLYPGAEPNDAHKILAGLEEKGKLKAVITQNIDNLHQRAGSKNVIELHGNVNRNFCLKCHRNFGVGYISESVGTPHCDKCGGIIKPDVVLYKEQLDKEAVSAAADYLENAGMLIVGGTSLEVTTAFYCIRDFFANNKNKAKKSVIINKSKTDFDYKFDISIHEKGIGKTLKDVYLKLYGE